ncbi:MAG TPA: glycoside hydrolase family 3 C-terminal domain-containing protein [Gemmatimonadaceae bacterium]|nr:glycoside hydrolase family 3 C-terminal domain-containing protein [Gemmatimonadaceae bacterium]
MRTLAAGAFVLVLAAGCRSAAPPPVSATGTPATVTARPPYLDPDLPIATRVADLVGRMTLAEKVSQLGNSAAAIPRLGVPAYNWWNEALHGVARAGTATVFPQAIGLAATWDTALMHGVATVIGVEARAKYAQAQIDNNRSTYHGLTFWSPNINILRDPRWGRGQETYGEDPWLTGRLAVAFIRGLQGDDPHYLRAIATPKHFAVHSGPEPGRDSFDAEISDRDLRQTYLPAFEAAIREGSAGSIMCSYNRIDGTPACANARTLDTILRREWGFRGYVVTDCDAVADMVRFHHSAPTTAAADAMAIRAGTDLDCGSSFRRLDSAVAQHLVAESSLDTSVSRLFTARFRLGLFDPPGRVKYASIPPDSNDTPGHAALALEAAERSIVLLKNDGLLPLRRGSITDTVGAAVSGRDRRIAVIGPNADDVPVLLGNYNGTPSAPVTPLAGIRQAAGPGAVVEYARGSTIAEGLPDSTADSTLLRQAVALARRSDVAILCLGLSPRLEGEAMSVRIPGFDGGDRTSLDLPAPQERLLEAVAATGTPVVLVLVAGSAVAVTWAAEHVPAIIDAWYPGEAGGTAIARVVFGDANPGGRLPATFYRSVSDLPPFQSYAMAGRTYRFFAGDVLYPFGYGLSYTTFAYSGLQVPARVHVGDSARVSVEVRNTGTRAGDEVVQLYVTDRSATRDEPIRSLAGFARVTLAPRERKVVRFVIRPRQLSEVTDGGVWREQPGVFGISVGGGQPGQRPMPGMVQPLEGRIEIVK